METVNLIQRQVPIGSNVSFFLKTGEQIAGILVEIGRTHITVQTGSEEETILIDLIGRWKVAKDITHPQDTRSIDLPVERQAIEAKEATASVHPIPANGRAKMPPPIPNEILQPVTQKLIEIETQYQVKTAAAQLQFIDPELGFEDSEFTVKHREEARKVWGGVTDRYRYAQKMNELGSQFGRIRPIIQQLETLREKFPGVASIYKALGFFYYLQNDFNKAIEHYKNAVSHNHTPADWHNMAYLALHVEQKETAVYALEQFFTKTPITADTDAWFCYINLLTTTQNYSNLHKIIPHQTSTNDKERLLEALIYLLLITNDKDKAQQAISQKLQDINIEILLRETAHFLPDGETTTYQATVAYFQPKPAKQAEKKEKTIHQPDGHIFSYFSDRGFGYLNSNTGQRYFFHRTAIIDPELHKKINNFDPANKIPVTFEPTEGPRGPLALRVTVYRTPDEILQIAITFADYGDYPIAIGYIRQLLERDPDHKKANDLYVQWREYARVTGVPSGSNPYARAKRVQLVEKDLDKAIKLFRLAIQQGDTVESAVKDLAQIFAQQGKPEQAVSLLEQNRNRVQNQQPIENLLISFYQNAGQYDKAVDLLNKKLKSIPKQKQPSILMQIGNCYLRQESYGEAKKIFETISRSMPDNLAIQRNIAICHFKQGDLQIAEKILETLLKKTPDTQSSELLEAIVQAKTTGSAELVNQIIVETTLVDLSGEISQLTQFFLNHCDFQGVKPARVNARAFDSSDIQQLESLATKSGTKRPRERAEYYLSAAAIISNLEDEDSNQFYKYLCRSFASRGDATVIEGKPLDSARELYCEALSISDKDRSQQGLEQDATNAFVRYLLSTLGISQINLTSKLPSIEDSIEYVLTHHPDNNQAFSAIAYLTFRSQFAANRILKKLHGGSTLQAMAVQYLNSKNLAVNPSINFNEFVKLWQKLHQQQADQWQSILSEVQLLRRIEITTASLSSGIERLKQLSHLLIWELDKERIRQTQNLLQIFYDLAKQTSFEERERLALSVDNRCRELLREFEINPTKLAIEGLYPVVQSLQEKIKRYTDELYISSTPQIELRLPEEFESYIPDNNGRIDVQIVIANKMGRSPAESLELIVPDDDLAFIVLGETQLDESLRGGEQKIVELPIKVTPQIMAAQTFSLPMYAQYKTRAGDTRDTVVYNFSIRLYDESEFEPIDNPYATYAEGGIVGDPTMFYGRQELLSNITDAIRQARQQSKCIVVFGQKRAGKSSILHHLKQQLEKTEELLVIDLGNLGAILDPNVNFLHQFLRTILKKLEDAIEDKVDDGFPRLTVNLPSDQEFYRHPSPLVLFGDVMRAYKREANKNDHWKRLRLVLLIDEFSYVYDRIVHGRIDPLFMKNWKALLQENYFSAVLAGQDVMPKFKQRFPNEFGTTQDERVTYLSRSEAERLIDEPIFIAGIESGSRYREKAIDHILALTAGSPFYIQIICDRLVKHMNGKKAKYATEAYVAQVRNELIRGINALSLDKFENLINSGDTSDDAISNDDALKVLKQIADNSQTGLCNRNTISCETAMSLDAILDDLVKRDVIEQEQGRYYKIRIGLFKEWLIANQ